MNPTAFVDQYRFYREQRPGRNQHEQHGVYVVRDGETIHESTEHDKQTAEIIFHDLAHKYTAADGYEVCLYVGVDTEMIASTWPRDEIN